MPRTCAVCSGWAVARLSTAAIVASTQASGSCSENSGAGCDSSRPCEAVATIAPVSFTSTAFTPDVPTSIPKNTNFLPLIPCDGRSSVASPARDVALRQIVPHHDIYSNLLLFTQDRLTPRQREQHTHRSTRLMP